MCAVQKMDVFSVAAGAVGLSWADRLSTVARRHVVARERADALSDVGLSVRWQVLRAIEAAGASAGWKCWWKISSYNHRVMNARPAAIISLEAVAVCRAVGEMQARSQGGRLRQCFRMLKASSRIEPSRDSRRRVYSPSSREVRDSERFCWAIDSWSCSSCFFWLKYWRFTFMYFVSGRALVS